jgi:hypothetical protein
LYLKSYLPPLFLLGLIEIDRLLLTSFLRSDIAFQCQIYSPFLHGLMAWLFAIKLEYGVIGLGIASTITHLTIFLAQRYVIYHLDDLQEAMKVSIFDKRNLNNMKEYMQMAI